MPEMSDETCRTCGRRGCEGGAACEVAAERRADAPYSTCVICGEEYYGYGNNADPVSRGKCCDECNVTKVLPERIDRMKKSEV